jgi:hypothetical protein
MPAFSDFVIWPFTAWICELIDSSEVRKPDIAIEVNRLSNEIFDNRICQKSERGYSRNIPFKTFVSKSLRADSRPPRGGVD